MIERSAHLIAHLLRSLAKLAKLSVLVRSFTLVTKLLERLA